MTKIIEKVFQINLKFYFAVENFQFSLQCQFILKFSIKYERLKTKTKKVCTHCIFNAKHTSVYLCVIRYDSTFFLLDRLFWFAK